MFAARGVGLPGGTLKERQQYVAIRSITVMQPDSGEAPSTVIMS
jgi:hypothetical protein